jgi:hypothetical protein
MSAALTLLPALAFAMQAGAPADDPAPPTEQTAPPAAPSEEDSAPPSVDNDSIEGRRRPGYDAELPDQLSQTNPGAVRAPPPEAFPTDQIPIPDRWRLIESLGLV